MRPLHLDWRLASLVFVGGMVGTSVREGLSLSLPAAPTGFPVTVFVINLVGSFALGLLLQTLSRRGPDEGRRRQLRLGVGTGVIGGFTTYSALATDVATRLPTATGTAIVYAVSSVILGALAAAAGIALSSWLHRRRLGRSLGSDQEGAG